MSLPIGDCRFCPNTSIELQHSHIIPEFCYTRVYTSQHKLKAFSVKEENDLEIEQKGYREHLLCSECELKFCRWENDFRWFMEDIINEEQKILTITKLNNLEIIEGFNYEYIKRAILSIIWRLSTSSLPPFKKYNLGPYEDKLKALLLSNEAINVTDYPVVINKGFLKGKFMPDILAHWHKGRYANIFSMQTITIQGFIIDILICENRNIPKEFQLFCLNNESRVILPYRDYEDRDFDIQAFGKRFQEDSVKDFYEKYN